MTLYLDDNLEQQDDGSVMCRHCGQQLGDAAAPLRDARVTEQPAATAGPGIRSDAAIFTDRPIVFRQSFCPQCLTSLQAEIVPGDEESARHRTLGTTT